MRSCIVIVGGLELCNTSNVIATSYLDATSCVICGITCAPNGCLLANPGFGHGRNKVTTVHSKIICDRLCWRRNVMQVVINLV
jgi:hypothetical protein